MTSFKWLKRLFLWAAGALGVYFIAVIVGILPNPSCGIEVSCAQRSVVSVLPVWHGQPARLEEPEGSGIAVADGRLVATAAHVLGPAERVFVRTHDGDVLPAEIAFRDHATDIALLTVQPELIPFTFRRRPLIGTKACAIGNGFGLDLYVSCGILSAKRVSGAGFNLIEDFLQTDAAVNPGMSGGALIDENGQLIGMLSAIFTKQSDANVGVNFAVSAELLSRVVDDFLSHGEVRRVSPGISVRRSPEVGQAGVAGARIVRVNQGSAEDLAGLRVGDIIVKTDGRRIKRAGAYRTSLALISTEKSIPVEILRGGVRITVTVQFD